MKLEIKTIKSFGTSFLRHWLHFIQSCLSSNPFLFIAAYVFRCKSIEAHLNFSYETPRVCVLQADSLGLVGCLRAASAGSVSGVLFDPWVCSLHGAQSQTQTTAKTPHLFIVWPLVESSSRSGGLQRTTHLRPQLGSAAAHTETLWTDECSKSITVLYREVTETPKQGLRPITFCC